MIVCAAPSYLEAKGKPAAPSDLAQHTCLSSSRDWPFVHGDRPITIRIESRWTSNNGVALVRAARQGLGITRVAETYLARDVQMGRLVPLLQDWEVEPQPTVLVYPSRDRMPHRLRTLIAYLVERLGTG